MITRYDGDVNQLHFIARQSGVETAPLVSIDRSSAGNVGIGTTAPGFQLEVNGSAGKPGGGSWSISSDRRLKKNVAGLQGSLDKLMQLRGVTYEYIDPQSINELAGRADRRDCPGSRRCVSRTGSMSVATVTRR